MNAKAVLWTVTTAQKCSPFFGHSFYSQMFSLQGGELIILGLEKVKINDSSLCFDLRNF